MGICSSSTKKLSLYNSRISHQNVVSRPDDYTTPIEKKKEKGVRLTSVNVGTMKSRGDFLKRRFMDVCCVHVSGWKGRSAR